MAMASFKRKFDCPLIGIVGRWIFSRSHQMTNVHWPFLDILCQEHRFNLYQLNKAKWKHLKKWKRKAKLTNLEEIPILLANEVNKFSVFINSRRLRLAQEDLWLGLFKKGCNHLRLSGIINIITSQVQHLDHGGSLYGGLASWSQLCQQEGHALSYLVIKKIVFVYGVISFKTGDHLEEKGQKRGISHLLTAEPMPEVHIDNVGVEEDVHLLGRTEIQLVKAEQQLDVQVCCHPPGMMDHAKPLCLHGVWLIFNGKKPNLVMTKWPSGWQLLNLSVAQKMDILLHSYIIYVLFWHWFSSQKMTDAPLLALLLQRISSFECK